MTSASSKTKFANRTPKETTNMAIIEKTVRQRGTLMKIQETLQKQNPRWDATRQLRNQMMNHQGIDNQQARIIQIK